MSNVTQWSELFDAIEQGDKARVERLVEEESVCLKSTVDANKQTAAHVAAYHGNIPILTYLVQKDINLLYVPDKSEQTVLHVVAKRGHLNMFKYLVEKLLVDLILAENRLKGDTPLHLAAEEGHLPIIKYYLKEYSPPGNPNLRNEDGETLMMSAANKARLPVVEYLAEEGFADPTLVDHYDGNILFHSARIGDLTVPKYILEEIVVLFDADDKNLFGMTVIFLAARFNHLDFIKYFVESRNATVDVPNNMGMTALHEAAQEGHVDIVKYLVEKNADTEKKEMHGKTPLDLAKKKEVIEFLQEVERKRAEKVEEQPQRSRRMAPEFVEHSPLHPEAPIPCKWIQKIITDQQWSSSGRITGNPGSETVDGISSMDSFLALAGACAKYVKGVGYEQIRHQSLLSPKEIIQDRMDPIAFDAVDAMYDFEYPHVNNI